MLIRAMTVAALLAATATAASAQSPAGRGQYLVNTIMTCQSCHTPKGLVQGSGSISTAPPSTTSIRSR